MIEVSVLIRVIHARVFARVMCTGLVRVPPILTLHGHCPGLFSQHQSITTELLRFPESDFVNLKML